MKKYLLLSLYLIGIGLLSSCEKELAIEPASETPVKVSFVAPIPQIDSYDESITKADESTNDYTYFIRIKQYNNNTSSYEVIAAGDFDALSKASIDLYKSKKYEIEAFVINHFYSSGNYISSRSGGFGRSLGNKYYLNDDTPLSYWYFNNNWSDAYYKQITDYSPSDDGVCQLSLDSISTGIKVSVSGKNSGKLVFDRVWGGGYFKGLAIPLSENTDFSSYLTFASFLDGWDSAEVSCSWKYEDENGIMTTLKEDLYTFTKGKRNVFNIVFPEESVSPQATGFQVTFEDSPTLTEEDPITIDSTE